MVSSQIITFTHMIITDIELRGESTYFDHNKYHTNHWAVELEDGVDPHEIAARHGHEYVGPVGSLRGMHCFSQKSSTVLGVTHPPHEISKEIKWAEQQTARLLAKRQIYQDPLFEAQ